MLVVPGNLPAAKCAHNDRIRRRPAAECAQNGKIHRCPVADCTHSGEIRRRPAAECTHTIESDTALPPMQNGRIQCHPATECTSKYQIRRRSATEFAQNLVYQMRCRPDAECASIDRIRRRPAADCAYKDRIRYLLSPIASKTSEYDAALHPATAESDLPLSPKSLGTIQSDDALPPKVFPLSNVLALPEQQKQAKTAANAFERSRQQNARVTETNQNSCNCI